MPTEKTISMADAVEQIEPGSSVALGLALEHAIPFAAGHEMIRQEISDLTLIGPISDLLFDQCIGAGIVARVRAAWVGNVSTGSGYCFRRAVEEDRLDVENHSNFSIAMALQAGTMGVPYLPTKSLLGSDILAESEFIEDEDPFTGDPLVLVPAITPDWTVVHVQRADPYGDAHLWGNSGVTPQAVDAAENVLLTAEEVVDPEVIRSDPSRVSIIRDQVTAVVECPHGAHPSPVAGRYNRDNEYYLEYAQQTKTPEEFEAWLAEWVHGVETRAEYYPKVDRELSISEPATAAEVTYGQ